MFFGQFKAPVAVCRAKTRGRAGLRQMMLALSIAVAGGAGCTTGESGTSGEIGTVGYITGFLGGVSADEPRATLVGRDVLAAGGSAADAAVAMYFTLAVTKPAAASLGGGGVCVVHNLEEKKTEALNFLAVAPARFPETATRPSAVPGNPRGFFALHARYGVLRWEQLLAPAARLARFGMPMSRSMAADFRMAETGLMADREVVRVFGGAGDRLVGEGDHLVQQDLAVTLNGIMMRGPGDFYMGNMAARLVKAVSAAGGSLSPHDLRAFRPVWQETVAVPFGFNLIHIVPPPASAGTVAGVMLAHLKANGRFAEASPEERIHLLAEAALRAYGDRGRWLAADESSTLDPSDLGSEERFGRDMADYSPSRHTTPETISSRPAARPENPSGTNFLAVDRLGNAVVCGLTMNGFFGTGRLAPDTGIVLATVPGDGGRGPMSMTPMIISNPNNGALFFAGSAEGGVAAPTALAGVAAYTLIAGETLSDAVHSSRVHHGGLPDATFVEDDAPAFWFESLRAKGHQVRSVNRIGRVNAFVCPQGLLDDRDRKTCAIVADPRDFGLALSSDG